MNRYKVSETPNSAGVFHVTNRVDASEETIVYRYDRYLEWWSCEEDGPHVPSASPKPPCGHVRAAMEAQRC